MFLRCVFFLTLHVSVFALDTELVEWLDNNVSHVGYTETVEALLATVSNTAELQTVIEFYIPDVPKLEKRAKLLYYSAMLLELWGDYPRAIENYRAAYTVDSQSSYIYRAAILLYEMGLHTESERLLKIAARSDDDDFLLLSSRLAMLDDDPIAVAKQTSQHENAGPAELYLYFSTLLQQGKTEEARIEQELLAERYPDSPEAMLASQLIHETYGYISEFPSLSRILNTLLVATPPDSQDLIDLATEQDISPEQVVVEDAENLRRLVGLQVASFINKASAEDLQKVLEKKVLSSELQIYSVNIEGKTYFRVVVLYDNEQFPSTQDFYTGMLEQNIEGILLYD